MYRNFRVGGDIYIIYESQPYELRVPIAAMVLVREVLQQMIICYRLIVITSYSSSSFSFIYFEIYGIKLKNFKYSLSMALKTHIG